MKTTLVVAVALSATLGLTLLAQPRYTPARFEGGATPGLAPMAVGGGQVIVELGLEANGTVKTAKALRSTPPFTQLLLDSVRFWRFTPATEESISTDGKATTARRIPSKVIVAAVYRAPALQGATQGERPKDTGPVSADVAYPTTIREPVFPPTAPFGGVVMIEVRVTGSGAVADARVIHSAAGFDAPALDAARQWRFRPARLKGGGDTYAYLVFGFPQPVTTR